MQYVPESLLCAPHALFYHPQQLCEVDSIIVYISQLCKSRLQVCKWLAQCHVDAKLQDLV